MEKRNIKQTFNLFFPLSADKNKIQQFVKKYKCRFLSDNPFVVQIKCSLHELEKIRKVYDIQSIDALTKKQNSLHKGDNK